ncbi:MAG: hypothetical protein PHE54_03720 [Bacilli bacterium]|nr:hypothetical protein [Bacilli bacterium]
MNRIDITKYDVYMQEHRGSDNGKYWIYDVIKKLVKTYPSDCDYDIMEKLASDILNYLEIDCINVELGINNLKNCCIIDSFETESESLYDIVIEWKDIKKGSIYEEIGLCFEQMFFHFEHDLYKISFSDLAQIKKAYIRMILGDCIIGNFDRHLGNVGILFDEKREKFRLAPSYDNAMAFKGYKLFKIHKCCIGKQSFSVDKIITYIVHEYRDVVTDIAFKLDLLQQSDIEKIVSRYEIDLGKQEYIIKYIRIISQIINYEKSKDNINTR